MPQFPFSWVNNYVALVSTSPKALVSFTVCWHPTPELGVGAFGPEDLGGLQVGPEPLGAMSPKQKWLMCKIKLPLLCPGIETKSELLRFSASCNFSWITHIACCACLCLWLLGCLLGGCDGVSGLHQDSAAVSVAPSGWSSGFMSCLACSWSQF